MSISHRRRPLPSTIGQREYRRVLGRLPTGVTIVTAFTAAGAPTGLSANSVTSVSLDPPMILVCPAKTSTTWPTIRERGTFCVNVMASHHAELCRRFARKGVDRFAGIGWHARPAGPGLDEAIAWLECDMADEHDAGDHTVVLGAVRRIESASDGAPLVFYRGHYGTFS
jgi:3-hydroxy-9,10-secoandrosta-1,3,5(10)-triene-9,17-dione monooxygenase reductase component